ncbi:MAG: hypothetical protein SGJ10_03855 [Bacteroidota bacterium]|nr:hypothetical protein [Bacteroidota bacterium]
MVNQVFEQFVENNLKADTKQLALKAKNIDGLDISRAITQIGLLQKSIKKIPVFFEKRCLLSQKSYEQASSERVAIFKSSLVSGKNLLDLTGGLGVDDYFFSKYFEKITSLDPDVELNEIVRYNFAKLGVDSIKRIDTKAEDYIAKCKESFSIIYADPDRRDSNKQRKIHVRDWQPDISAMLPQIFEHTNTFTLKLSPLFDLDELFKLFPNVSHLYVISEGGEVKELFCIMQKQHTAKAITYAVEINANDVLLCNSDNESHSSNTIASETEMYLYEAGNALVKSKLWRPYAEKLELDLMESNTPLLLSNKLIQPFMGRVFKVAEQVPYKNKDIAAYIKVHKLQQANVTRHNFNENVAELRKRWKLKEGGNDYLFFANSKMYHCVKVRD